MLPASGGGVEVFALKQGDLTLEDLKAGKGDWVPILWIREVGQRGAGQLVIVTDRTADCKGHDLLILNLQRPIMLRFDLPDKSIRYYIGILITVQDDADITTFTFTNVISLQPEGKPQ